MRQQVLLRSSDASPIDPDHQSPILAMMTASFMKFVSRDSHSMIHAEEFAHFERMCCGCLLYVMGIPIPTCPCTITYKVGQITGRQEFSKSEASPRSKDH